MSSSYKRWIINTRNDDVAHDKVKNQRSYYSLDRFVDGIPRVLKRGQVGPHG